MSVKSIIINQDELDYYVRYAYEMYGKPQIQGTIAKWLIDCHYSGYCEVMRKGGEVEIIKLIGCFKEIKFLDPHPSNDKIFAKYFVYRHWLEVLISELPVETNGSGE